MVDFLRSCYSTECRFYRDDPRTAIIQWFFTEDDAEDLGFGTAFTSNEWLDVPEGDQELGEVPGATRNWVNGAPPFPVAGDEPCGDEEDFQLGESVPPVPPVDTGVFGGITCCALPPSPFVFYSCHFCPVGAYDRYTLQTSGIGPVPQFAPLNGLFNLFYVGSCEWDSPPFSIPLDPGHVYQYKMGPSANELGIILHRDNNAGSAIWNNDPNDWDCVTIKQVRVVGGFAPLTAINDATLIPGKVSVPGLFCPADGAFLPATAGIRVQGAGQGLLSAIRDQTIALQQFQRCVYRGTCLFVNAVLRFRITIGVTCEVRFLGGGVIEFAGQSPRGAPFFYSATVTSPWDGSPVALMLDQPVPPFLGLPQSITLFQTSDLPP